VEFLLGMAQPAAHLADLVALLDKPPQLSGREVCGQSDGGQGLAPSASGRGEFLFGPGELPSGRIGVLPGSRPPALQRHKFLQLGQFAFGRLQPADDLTAATGKLPIQFIALLVGLLDLQLEQVDLLSTVLKLAGGCAFEHDLAQPRRCASPQPQKRQGPAERTGNGGRHEQAGREQHHPEHEHRTQARGDPNRQKHPIEQPAALLFQFGLVSVELIEPLVELHLAAELRDQVSRAVHGTRQVGLVAHRKGGNELLGK